MKTTLSLFEGHPVQASVLKVTGGASEKIGTLDQDEEVFLIVKGHVSQITHGYVRETYTRLHKVVATDLVVLNRTDGMRMLDEAMALQDDRFGLQQLFATSGGSAVLHDPVTGEIAEAEADATDHEARATLVETDGVPDISEGLFLGGQEEEFLDTGEEDGNGDYDG